jgi:hypothetical protein
MLRKISRNFARWFHRSSWKHKAKVELLPPASPLKPGRAKPTSLTEIVNHHLEANGRLLMPILPDFGQWQDLLPTGGPDADNDVIALLVGTSSQLLSLMHDFITQQKPDTNSVAILAGATPTPADMKALARREQEHPYWVRQSIRTDTGWRYLDVPPSHRIISRPIGQFASTGGNGGNPRIALQNLLTDSYTARDIHSFVEEVNQAFRDYAPRGCALFTVQGGGGTDPYQRCAVADLKRLLPVNRHYNLYLLPSAAEPLHLPNMKAILAYELEHEAASTLYFLFQQQNPGAQKTDRAMVSGFITLTGASEARLNGGMDATNKFSLLKEIAGTWLIVTPTVVPLTLVPMGNVEWRDGYRHEQHYLVSPPDELGGQRVSPILTEINNLLAEDPAAPHFITVASSLNPDEMESIRTGVQRFPLEPGGRAHIFFNPCYPTFDPLTETAEAYVCDFRGGSGVRALLCEFLLDMPGTAVSNGFSPAERVWLARQVTERALTEVVEREINRIVRNTHR